MRILVTGGSGFIGRNLVEALGGRHQLLAPTRRELDLLDGEAVRRFLTAHRPEAVVHLATTPGHRNAPPAPDLAAKNLRLFLNLFECSDRFDRMICVGSGAEYDLRFPIVRAPEEQAGQSVPADDTGVSKLAISRLVASRPGWVHLRPFGVYGKHEDWEIRLLSNAACKAIFGLPITLRQDRRFDYVHVDDLVAVIGRFLETPPRHRVYNVTPDAPAQLRDLVELVRELAGSTEPVLVAREGQGLEYSGDNRRLREELPDLQPTPIREGLTRLVSWYREHRALIRREALQLDK